MEPEVTPNIVDVLYPPKTDEVPEDTPEPTKAENVDSSDDADAVVADSESKQAEEVEKPEESESASAEEKEVSGVVKSEEEGESEESEGEDPEVEEVEVTTLELLAEHLETDKDWIEGLKVTQKINGKEVEVSLGEALATHRKVEAADDVLADAKTKAKEILDEANSSKEKISGNVATFASLITLAEQELLSGINEQELKELRNSDPAEWTARQREIEQKLARIQQAKQQGIEAAKGVTSLSKEEQRKMLDERLPDERKVLQQRLPEWSKQDVATAESQKAAKYMAEQGYTEDEINLIAYSGRDLAVIVKAMRYDQQQKSKDTAKKKVVKIPKVMKPGTKSEARKPTRPKDPVSALYGKR